MSSSAIRSRWSATSSETRATISASAFQVHRLGAAKALQHPLRLQLAQHAARFARVDRREPHRRVLQQFDEDAAEADDDHRAELRVDARADHDLGARRHHRLHEHAVDARRRRDRARVAP